MSVQRENQKIQLKDLLFFDNLALYYLIQETPLSVLAKAFLVMDKKLANSIYSILSEKQKETLKIAISLEKKTDLNNNKALESLPLIAQNLYEKGLIIKKGNYFFGKEKK